MRVTEHLAKATDPLISFEIIPPQRGGDLHGLLKVIDDIVKYNPPFIDITSHPAEVVYEETPSGIQKKVMRKRPGTLGICALIQHKYSVDAVPHILCRNFTREETEDFLIELGYLGIENVLAIRGDDTGFLKPVPEGKTANIHAVDLVQQIAEMNQGKYLEENLLDARPSHFCIGVSGYPEKHFEAPNLKADLGFTAQKIRAGAEYIVTQMFFENEVYYQYCKQCEAAGLTVPIIPGLKIVTMKSHLRSIPRNFFVNFPDAFVDEVMAAKDEHVIDIGVEWAARQVADLLNHGVPAIHFYIMQNSKPVNLLMKKLGLAPGH
jgi:methylenetetrahydrofolate reductase (NADPH)